MACKINFMGYDLNLVCFVGDYVYFSFDIEAFNMEKKHSLKLYKTYNNKLTFGNCLGIVSTMHFWFLVLKLEINETK